MAFIQHGFAWGDNLKRKVVCGGSASSHKHWIDGIAVNLAFPPLAEARSCQRIHVISLVLVIIISCSLCTSQDHRHTAVVSSLPVAIVLFFLGPYHCPPLDKGLINLQSNSNVPRFARVGFSSSCFVRDIQPAAHSTTFHTNWKASHLRAS